MTEQPIEQRTELRTSFYGRPEQGQEMLVTVWQDPLKVEVTTRRVTSESWGPFVILTKIGEDE